MIPYILKVILCSGLLVLVYKLLLEKEKMHRFNRVYLLSALALSFIFPALTFSSSATILPSIENFTDVIDLSHESIAIVPPSPTNAPDYTFMILLTVYITITTLLFLRFANNLNKIFFKMRNNPVISYGTSKVVLIKEDLAPHSFLNASL